MIASKNLSSKMKTKNNLLFLSFILITFLFQACAPKISKPLQGIQELYYTSAWEKVTAYPVDRGRSDDLHFFDPETGFVINSQGYLSYTEDGGESWKIVHKNEGTFFRCLTFKNRKEGWLGTIGTDDRFLSSKDTVAMYETKDGGLSWKPVEFIGPNPKGLCGLQKVTDDFIVGCGRVRGPSYFIKTTDGGKNWYSYDLNHLAGSLIATHFFDDSHGFMIGGTTDDKKNSQSLVLETFDGGMTWDTAYISPQKGEYCWKFSFPTPEIGFISIQRNVRKGRFYHLQTTDGGKTWKEVEHTSRYYYVQGIGFINSKIGWMGGSNNWTYETRDGGENWRKVKDIGKGFNNFQFFGDTLAYGVGFGVFKSTKIHTSNDQVLKEYYENGQIKSTTTFKKDRKSGPANTYFTNGKVASEGKYEKNLKHGVWNYYDVSGKLVKRVKMKHGQVKVAEKQLQSYAGEYETPSGIIRRISLEEGLLFSKRGNGAKRLLLHDTDTRFYYEFDPQVTIEFFFDENGAISHTQTCNYGEYSTAERTK